MERIHAMGNWTSKKSGSWRPRTRIDASQYRDMKRASPGMGSSTRSQLTHILQATYALSVHLSMVTPNPLWRNSILARVSHIHWSLDMVTLPSEHCIASWEEYKRSVRTPLCQRMTVIHLYPYTSTHVDCYAGLRKRVARRWHWRRWSINFSVVCRYERIGTIITRLWLSAHEAKSVTKEPLTSGTRWPYLDSWR